MRQGRPTNYSLMVKWYRMRVMANYIRYGYKTMCYDCPRDCKIPGDPTLDVKYCPAMEGSNARG